MSRFLCLSTGTPITTPCNLVLRDSWVLDFEFFFYQVLIKAQKLRNDNTTHVRTVCVILSTMWCNVLVNTHTLGSSKSFSVYSRFLLWYTWFLSCFKNNLRTGSICSTVYLRSAVTHSHLPSHSVYHSLTKMMTNMAYTDERYTRTHDEHMTRDTTMAYTSQSSLLCQNALTHPLSSLKIKWKKKWYYLHILRKEHKYFEPERNSNY